ncbi:MAG TPA: glycosyltransferase [Solirubrobacteraceae bacterium]|jgi:glycosyltransferase involved in cell wall biosynthesis|nr:glycosyltransferase [Solirubrobacteraceae bacterium]
MRFVSLIAPGQLPQAQVLARSLRRAHPDATLEGIVIGSPPARAEPALGLRSVADELGLDPGTLLGRHETGPLLALLVAELLGAAREPIVHLPASTLVTAPLEPLLGELERHPVVLVARTRRDPPDDGLEPTPKQLREQAGRISPVLMAVDGSEGARPFLRWWRGRLARTLGTLDGYAADRRQRPWAYRFLEIAPSRFSIPVLEDPGVGVSQWNLHEHAIGAGPTVDGGGPLRLIDLEGFDPERPWQLGPRAARVQLSREPALQVLTRRYAGELLQAGFEADPRRRGEIGRELAPGIVFDPRLSNLLGQARALGEDFGDIFSPAGFEAFLDWLRGPGARGAQHGVSRYLYEVWRERPDIPEAYPDLDGRDGPQFTGWCRVYGRSEMNLPEALLPPPPAHVGPELEPEQLGVRLSGYLGHTLGLGAAARAYAAALQAAGVPVTTATVSLDHLQLGMELDEGYGRSQFAELAHDGRNRIELIAVNADELPGFIDRAGRAGPQSLQGPRVAIWGWETDTIPDRWKWAYPLVDEIWVYSRFVAGNLGRMAPVPVACLPPPVSMPSTSERLRLDVPDGFLFLFVFDYLSTLPRKNPVGLVRAFQRAFAPGEGPQLLIKTINAPLRPLAREELRWAIEDRADIHLIDRSLSTAQRDALMNGCDCYVSLHRAEGFGLTLAEAMALGKPVIATGFSGNVDFMNPSNSLLVDYRPVRVGVDVEIYPAHAVWAEPSVEHAAALMRRVVEDPHTASTLGERAAADIARQLSPEATGRAMRARLELLLARSEQ